jgi:hypothetical protein
MFCLGYILFLISAAIKFDNEFTDWSNVAPPHQAAQIKDQANTLLIHGKVLLRIRPCNLDWLRSNLDFPILA